MSFDSSVASRSPNPVYHHLEDQDPDETAAAAVTASETDGGSSSNNSISTNASTPPLLFQRQRRQRQWAVVLLSACTILLFADQNLMAPNLSAIADFFGFDNEERDRKLGGHIALAFWLLGAPASFAIGCLADTTAYNRSRLFAFTVFTGEGACLATFWVTTYPQLYVCRALTGVSVGGALPLIYSILGDMYAANERHQISALVGIGMGIGVSVGQGVAGFVGPTFGWRLPFLLISVPSLVCAAAFWIIVDDPERGGMETAVILHRESRSIEMSRVEGYDNNNIDQRASIDRISQKASSEDDDATGIPSSQDSEGFDFRVQWQTFRSLISTPTLVMTVLQGAPGCLPWGIFNTYLPDYLAIDRGMGVEYATFVLMINGLGIFCGMLLGGYGGGWLYSLDNRYPSLLAGGAVILGCFPFWFLLNNVDASTSFFVMAPVSIFMGLCR